MKSDVKQEIKEPVAEVPLREKCSNTEFFFGRFFPSFGLNTERYEVSLRIQSKRGKIRTRKTPYLDTFYAVYLLKT